MFTDQQIINDDMLREIVNVTWATFFGTEVVAGDAVPSGDVVSASIAIGGPWTATIYVAFTAEAARIVAAALVGLEADEIGDDDIADAIGELANIVGGNVKGIVSDQGDGWTLSLPTVADATQSFPGSILTVRSVFAVEGGLPMVWEIHERS